MTKRGVQYGPSSSYLVLIASLSSTVRSLIWLVLAAKAPHYGAHIRPGGLLTPGTASTLSTAIAKSIELTFVTVSVAFIGQTLSHRALKKRLTGITIADMQIRTWILQPGTTITHFATVRHAAYSWLGALTLLTAFLAMVYTTASDALGKIPTSNSVRTRHVVHHVQN